jgi:hypothetical protein
VSSFDGQSYFELSPASRAQVARFERRCAELRGAAAHAEARSRQPGLSPGRRRWLSRQSRKLTRELARLTGGEG